MEHGNGIGYRCGVMNCAEDGSLMLMVYHCYRGFGGKGRKFSGCCSVDQNLLGCKIDKPHRALLTLSSSLVATWFFILILGVDSVSIK